MTGDLSTNDLAAGLRGRGAVVLVGGFWTTEHMLAPMRGWLECLGYQVLTHTLNTGMACGARSVETVRDVVRHARLLDDRGDGVRVVGYSRGGQFARLVAATGEIDALVTIGAPFDLLRMGLPAMLPTLAVTLAGSVGVPNMAGMGCLVGRCCAEYRRGLRGPVPVPFTSVYSRQDRLVPWRGSVDPHARNVEVRGTHIDLLDSRESMVAVARALAPAHEHAGAA